MSATDIRLSVGLPTHPKTKKLRKLLGNEAAWALVCLFVFAAQNKPDGDLSGMDVEDIEIAVDWEGEDGAFVAALVKVGFLNGEEGSYKIHDWAEHNRLGLWLRASQRQIKIRGAVPTLRTRLRGTRNAGICSAQAGCARKHPRSCQ